MMENEKDIVLRNAIGGYNKSDVNEYIASMAKEFSRREEEWYTEKESLNGRRRTSGRKKRDVRSFVTSLPVSIMRRGWTPVIRARH